MKYFCGISYVCEYEQGYVFEIPMAESEKKMNRNLTHLLKKVRKAGIDTVVFSKDCENSPFYSIIENAFLQNENEILAGRKLMHYMNNQILEYIFRVQGTAMEKEDVFFLIKKDDGLNLQFLSKFVEKCKTVSIVTNDIGRFKKVQENLYKNESILISISNNKAKALKRAKYILNVNMEKKDLEKFKINRDAIIINFNEAIYYQNPAFNGINVNYFTISMPDEYIEQTEKISPLGEFDITYLYEAILLKKIEDAKKKGTMLTREELIKHKKMMEDFIKEDDIHITGLIGNNGKISEEEFIQNYQKVIRN